MIPTKSLFLRFNYFLFLTFVLWLPINGASSEMSRWEGQTKNVSIVRDDWGIAHVTGKTDADAIFGFSSAVEHSAAGEFCKAWREKCGKHNFSIAHFESGVNPTAFSAILKSTLFPSQKSCVLENCADDGLTPLNHLVHGFETVATIFSKLVWRYRNDDKPDWHF